MELLTLHFWGITLSEPITALTALILSVLCFTIVRRIKRICADTIFHRGWKSFFFWMAISTAIGTIAHAGQSYMSANVFNVIWMTMNLCASLAAFFCLKASIIYLDKKYHFHKFLGILNLITLITFISLAVIFNNFNISKIYAGIGLVGVLTVHLKHYLKNHTPSKFIVAGILISFFTIFIHTEKISISAWFNYKDISHVIMFISLILIAQGVYIMNLQAKPVAVSANE